MVRKVVLLGALLLLASAAPAFGRVQRGASSTIAASPSSLTDGANVTVKFSISNPAAGDYMIPVSVATGNWGGLWADTDTCNESGGNTAVASGTCSISTTTISPGQWRWQLYHASGSLAATSSTQTSTADPTIGLCPTPEPTGSVTSGGHTWTLAGEDDFNKAAAVGSFQATTNSTPVYTGDQGLGWTEYPDGWKSTFSGTHEGYQPSTVQSVHNGVLDWYLHNDAQGHPVSANPSPDPHGSAYQTYGRYSFCEKIAASDTQFLDDFKQAILLWPSSDANGSIAESDFPEGRLNQNYFQAYAHHTGGQDVFYMDAVDGDSINTNQWHVYTQEWGPGYRNYYIDGVLIGTSTSAVWSQPERWQLQVEPSGSSGDGATGHVYVDWAAIWTY